MDHFCFLVRQGKDVPLEKKEFEIGSPVGCDWRAQIGRAQPPKVADLSIQISSNYLGTAASPDG
jgi:hypothetical protein